MFLAAVATSGSLFRTPTFWVDSRDTVDSGGFVASVADRVNGWSFGADVSGNRPTIDTALLGGTKLIYSPSSAINLRYVTTDTGFGGDDVPVSFVVRFRPDVVTNLTVLGTGTAGGDGYNRVGTLTTPALRFARDPTSVGPSSYDPSTSVSANSWYTIGVSFTGSAVRMFKNGVFLQHYSSALSTLGTHTTIALCNNAALSGGARGYYAGFKGWVNAAISDAQHLYEHNQLAAWAA